MCLKWVGLFVVILWLIHCVETTEQEVATTFTPLLISLTAANKNMNPLTAIAITKSLVFASLSTRNFQTLDDVLAAASKREVYIGVHTVLGIDTAFVKTVAGFTDDHSVKLERMDRPQEDCWMGNVFEYYDAIVTTDQYFPILLRQNRDCYRTRPLFRTLNSTDLNMIIISPFEMVFYNQSLGVQQDQVVNYLFGSMLKLAVYLSTPQSLCNQYYITHDYATFRTSQGLMNISQSQLSAMNTFFTYPMLMDRSFIELALLKLRDNLTIPDYDSLSLEMSSVLSTQKINTFFPSSCYSCKTSQCMWQDDLSPTPSYSDPVSIGAGVLFIVSILVFYPALFYFRNKESIKRRLIVPYVCTLSIVITQLIQVFQWVKPCYLLYQITHNFVATWSIIIYATISFRFLLLRNMYKVLKHANERQIAITKTLASKWIGITVSVSFGFLVACIVAFVPLAAYMDVSIFIMTIVNDIQTSNFLDITQV